MDKETDKTVNSGKHDEHLMWAEIDHTEGETYVKTFPTEQDAVRAARDTWSHLTASERRDRSAHGGIEAALIDCNDDGTPWRVLEDGSIDSDYRQVSAECLQNERYKEMM